jgi:hypothetical protein
MKGTRTMNTRYRLFSRSVSWMMLAIAWQAVTIRATEHLPSVHGDSPTDPALAIPGAPAAAYPGAPPGSGVLPHEERWPVIVVGMVEKELGTVRRPRPGTGDWEQPISSDWAVVEVRVEQVLRGDAAARIAVRYLLMPQGGGAGYYHEFRPGERALLFLEETGEWHENDLAAYRVSPWERTTKIALSDVPRPLNGAKPSAVEAIQAELVHSLGVDDAYLLHEVMAALTLPGFFSDDAVPALRRLAGSPDPWLSLHALSLLASRTEDRAAFEEVVRRAETGDYLPGLGVLNADGTMTAGQQRGPYLHLEGASGWISSAISIARFPEDIPTLVRVAENAGAESWLRRRALERLLAGGYAPEPALWRAFLEAEEPAAQRWTMEHLCAEFDEHPVAVANPEMCIWEFPEDFERSREEFVEFWMGFLDVLEAERVEAASESGGKE